MDDIDKGNEHAENMLDAQIKRVRSKAADGLRAIGQCWNCDEPAHGLFCDSDCRDDYDRRARLSTTQRYQR